ncbi:MAG: FKBP-type peptidyl-prolyl cis-trans isomerase, partial [Candidatus Sumerlaeota bacterium]
DVIEFAKEERMEFTVGAGQVIPGFEQAVEGMETGEEKTFTIEPAEAYGPRMDELVQEVNRSMLPEDLEIEKGAQLMARMPETGDPVIFHVADVQGEKVTLDANHPLAGQDLSFEIELVDIVDNADE